MVIRKFFWPFITIAVFVVVMAVWFGVGGQEKHLSEELGQLRSETNWLSYDIDGFDVTLHGYAPDSGERDKVLAKVKALKNIGTVESDIILLSDQTNNYLMLVVDQDSITIRGTIPIGLARFGLINQISAIKPGMMVYDELDVGAIMPEKFKQAFSFFLDILPDMTTGVIALKGDKLTLDRATLYKIKDRQTSDKNIKIPENYQLDDRCIWDKPEGGYWQNSCSE
ncbi:unnamed protein product [Bartonella apihabitans]|uniref:hypothetical protein n=1 Tax=Bartonella apihabitans TaxID=2750929 RepID=UPI0018DD6ACA|nr:hypothetical protein [Bartonella apihabitans]MBI0167333.1 hypothetical protein [Bartonella apihabitans]